MAEGFTSAEFSNLSNETRLPTSLRRHSCNIASFSAVAVDSLTLLSPVAFGIPALETALEGLFAPLADEALGFDSVKAARGCGNIFLPETLMSTTNKPCCHYRITSFLKLVIHLLFTYHYFALMRTNQLLIRPYLATSIAKEEEEGEEEVEEGGGGGGGETAIAVPRFRRLWDFQKQYAARGDSEYEPKSVEIWNKRFLGIFSQRTSRWEWRMACLIGCFVNGAEKWFTLAARTKTNFFTQKKVQKLF